MKQVKVVMGIFFVTLFLINCKKNNPSNIESWSDYKGVLNWNDATFKCAIVFMRLPTKEELIIAYNAGVIKNWQIDNGFYWSSTFGGDDSSHAISAKDGFDTVGSHYHPLHVRCIR